MGVLLELATASGRVCAHRVAVETSALEAYGMIAPVGCEAQAALAFHLSARGVKIADF
jgi:hypothetical protein